MQPSPVGPSREPTVHRACTPSDHLHEHRATNAKASLADNMCSASRSLISPFFALPLLNTVVIEPYSICFICSRPAPSTFVSHLGLPFCFARATPRMKRDPRRVNPAAFHHSTLASGINQIRRRGFHRCRLLLRGYYLIPVVSK